jgi:hypothetical protein
MCKELVMLSQKIAHEEKVFPLRNVLGTGTKPNDDENQFRSFRLPSRDETA